MEQSDAPFNLDSFIRQRAEQQSGAPFNLDSFIRQRAEQQRQQPPPPLPVEPPPSRDFSDSASEKEPLSTPQPHTSSTPENPEQPAVAQGRVDSLIQQQISKESTEKLQQTTEAAMESHHTAESAIHQMKEEQGNSQVRLAAEAAQEAAQASLEAMEFAHEATRSAIEEANQGRAQKSIYSTHKLLITVSLLLFAAAAGALYLFGWPGAVPYTAVAPSPAPVQQPPVDYSATQALTQQLLNEQQKRLQSEKVLALMEQSLSKLQQEQHQLEKSLKETKTALDSERERSPSTETIGATFARMEKDLKQRIRELEERLVQEVAEVKQLPPPPVVAPVVVTAPPPPREPPRKESIVRKQEVDEILQKLYSLHSELSDQKSQMQQAKPYSYSRN